LGAVAELADPSNLTASAEQTTPVTGVHDASPLGRGVAEKLATGGVLPIVTVTGEPATMFGRTIAAGFTKVRSVILNVIGLDGRLNSSNATFPRRFPLTQLAVHVGAETAGNRLTPVGTAGGGGERSVKKRVIFL
jgi:hypothetical protein